GFPSEEVSAARWEKNRREIQAKSGVPGIHLGVRLPERGLRISGTDRPRDTKRFACTEPLPFRGGVIIANATTATLSLLRSCGPATREVVPYSTTPSVSIADWHLGAANILAGNVSGTPRATLLDRPVASTALPLVQQFPGSALISREQVAIRSVQIPSAFDKSSALLHGLRFAPAVVGLKSRDEIWRPHTFSAESSTWPRTGRILPLASPVCGMTIAGPDVRDLSIHLGPEPEKLAEVGWRRIPGFPQVPGLIGPHTGFDRRGAAVATRRILGGAAKRTAIRPSGALRYSPVSIIMMPPVEFELPQPALCEEDRLVERKPLALAIRRLALQGYEQPAPRAVVQPGHLARPWTRKNNVQGPLTRIINVSRDQDNHHGLPKFQQAEPYRKHPADFFIWPIPTNHLLKQANASSGELRGSKGRFQFGVKPPGRQGGTLGLKAG
ncbi:MAG: hypothetical protein ABI995_10145, partial [Acidobacteriota bacterium]